MRCGVKRCSIAHLSSVMHHGWLEPYSFNKLSGSVLSFGRGGLAGKRQDITLGCGTCLTAAYALSLSCHARPIAGSAQIATFFTGPTPKLKAFRS
eukprot:1159575-Pelagomonas_calceolata.AAC.6